MMGRLVHFEILVEDPQEVVKFYESVFGWEIATWGGEQAYWLVTTGPESEGGINGAIMGTSLPQKVINTVDVESLDDMIEKVKAAGGKLVHGPNEVPGVGMHAYCEDSQGVLFGMMQSFEDMGE
jgi:predicted enzyme related to lactoylglutathione lyase